MIFLSSLFFGSFAPFVVVFSSSDLEGHRSVFIETGVRALEEKWVMEGEKGC